jgi:thymidylate synthase
MMKGEIPVFLVEGETLPEAWEKSVLKVWEDGASIRTEYDKEGSPPSKDATMTFVVRKPFSEPRIHLAFPGGVEDLEKYRLEVVEGIHDHWIVPEEGKWTYTYHGRLFNYNVVDDLSSSKVKSPFPAVNQMEYVIKKLSEAPHSRRAQATTWMPTADPKTYDCPCLQRLWFRVIEDDDGVKRLEMNSHWRSRDAYKAAFMNIYALTDLQRIMAETISENLGEKVEVGRYVDISDSYHIYGFYFEEFENHFLKLVNKRTFEKRTWRSDDPSVQYSIKMAHKQLEDERKKEVEK